MPVLTESYQKVQADAGAKGATLIAVSKTKPVSDIIALYEAGHRDFGENYVQELTGKQPQLPEDIRWHFIGHLQSNKLDRSSQCSDHKIRIDLTSRCSSYSAMVPECT